MTTQQAMRAATDLNISHGDWKEVEAVLLRAGICPGCAREGERVRLGKVEPATHETYEGRECPQCEEFYPSTVQPGDVWDRSPDYGGAVGADGMSVAHSIDYGPWFTVQVPADPASQMKLL